MRVMFKTIIVIFFAFIIFITQANENVSDDKNLIAIVKQYYKAIEDVRQENAKESDVKKLVQLLSDGFKYEHPKFGAYGNRQEKQQVLIKWGQIHFIILLSGVRYTLLFSRHCKYD